MHKYHLIAIVLPVKCAARSLLRVNRSEAAGEEWWLFTKAIGGVPPVAQWVKDPALSLQQQGFIRWPRNSKIVQRQKKKKKKKSLGKIGEGPGRTGPSKESCKGRATGSQLGAGEGVLTGGLSSEEDVDEDWM